MFFLSRFFTKTKKEIPKEEKSINSQLLIKAGFIDKLMAGVYSYLPFGFRVLKKIEKIIREEMNKIGGQELLLPALHPKELWQKTNRWNYEEMFKLKNRRGKDFSLGWTHEEIITPLIQKFIHSYKDLPVYVYQIQDKFRDELRTKSGLLRGVEFIMKDLYSFHSNEKDLDNYYEKVKKSYFQIFKRCGLEKQTFLTLASGGSFSKYSHEFQVITPYGEDKIYLCQKCKVAINKEIIKKENYKCFLCGNKNLKIEKAIEVGNIFKLMDRFSQAFNFTFLDKDGLKKKIIMGCYGIGLGRLMGTIVEVHHDEKGIIWPKEVAPFDIHLISIFSKKSIENNKIKKILRDLVLSLEKIKIEILYDDREDKSLGEKFADADLIGIPYRIIISPKTIERNSVEIKKRKEEKGRLIKIKNLGKVISFLR